jgi:hypothetical protein
MDTAEWRRLRRREYDRQPPPGRDTAVYRRRFLDERRTPPHRQSTTFHDLYRFVPYSQVSPTAASQAARLNVYTAVTCRATTRASNASLLLWSGVAIFGYLWFPLSWVQSVTRSQASIPQMMCTGKSSAKSKMRRHRGALNSVHTLNSPSVISTPSLVLTARRISQICGCVYTKAATLEGQL